MAQSSSDNALVRVERSYASTTTRDADTFDYRHVGMLVFTQADGYTWQLGKNLVWQRIMFTNNPTATRRISVPMGANWYEVDGTALAAFAGGASNTPGLALDNSEAAGIRWNNAAAPDPICTTIVLPEDFDTSVAATLRVVASKTGATIGDATTFDVGLFNNVVGALRDADANYGGTTGAMTGDAATKTVQAVTLAIAAANLPTAPCAVTITLQPTDGTIGTDDVTVHEVSISNTPA